MASVAAGAAVGGLILGGVGLYQSNKNASRADKATNRAMRAQERVMSRQLALAEEQWDTYVSTFQPINEMLAADAKKGVVANYDARTSEANADVEMAYSGAEDERQRNMFRYGINPNDPRFDDSVRRSSLEKAKAKVGAINGARQNERNRSEQMTWAKRMDAASIGKGISSNAFSALNASGSSARGLGNMAGNQMNIANQQRKDTYDFVKGGTKLGFRAAENGWFDSPKADAGGWQPSEDGMSLTSGNGSDWSSDDGGYSGFADGGEITIGGKKFGGRSAENYQQPDPEENSGGQYGLINGPGNDVSDSVEAVVDGYKKVRLANGEFIIPPDVVKKKGTDFFNKMVAEDHTPVRRR